jgi:hypothetical protein
MGRRENADHSGRAWRLVSNFRNLCGQFLMDTSRLAVCPARDGSPMGETPTSSRGCGVDNSTSRAALFHRRRSVVTKAERACEP